MHDLLSRLSSNTPKRILALDGGGIRGIVSIGYLSRIESLLRERFNRPNLVLSDYFDLIGGTSTGSIIAAALAMGWSVEDIRHLYLNVGKKVFGKRSLQFWETKYSNEPLEAQLKDSLKDTALGSQHIRTGLCIVTKRADTGSTWPLHNHPNGRFFLHNRHIRLRDAIRASAAAPTYFEPEQLDVGFGEQAAFIDGGVSMANNPAWQLFMLATLDGYRFRWPTGENNLLLVSVGTGHWRPKSDLEEVLDEDIWDWAQQIPRMLMHDASVQNQMLLHMLSNSLTPASFGTEVGDLTKDLITPKPLLSYLRYDTEISNAGLKQLGINPNIVSHIEKLRDLDAVDEIVPLAEIGIRAANTQIQASHFPTAFDLP